MNADPTLDAALDRSIEAERSPPPTLGRSDRLQPLLLIAAIGAGLTLSKLAPRLSESIEPAITIGVIALIFLVMLGVDVVGVGRAFTQRRFLTVAISINFVVNPLLAWGLGSTFLGNEPELWAGLILFLVTPCIGWYLIFTELAGGDATLGVSLLAINVALQLLLLPVYLWLFAGRVLAIDITMITTSVATYLLLPFAAAAGVRRFVHAKHRTVTEVQTRLRLSAVKTGALTLVIVAMFASQGDALFDNPSVVWKIAPPIGLFFVLAFGVALVAARLAGLPYEQAALLVFTTTSRNSEASLAIAVTAFASPLVALTVVMGPVIELPLLVLMVRCLLALRTRWSSR
ncbi:MAG: arsenic resistance protein [Ilumatobacter sp.]